MNRYPVWKYIIMLSTLAVGLLYAIPNFFSEVPVVQISSRKANIRIDSNFLKHVEQVLLSSKIHIKGITFDNTNGNSILRVQLPDIDSQLHMKDVLEEYLNLNKDEPDYIIALNLQTNSPHWLSAIGIRPVYLGLDLRGGIHFLLKIDSSSFLKKRLSIEKENVYNVLKNQSIRFSDVNQSVNGITVNFPSKETTIKACQLLEKLFPEIQWNAMVDSKIRLFQVVGGFSNSGWQSILENALRRNIKTLYNRINQLGIAEPVVQRQGLDRIILELPGLQDTSKAKDIIGRTATLEAHLVESQSSIDELSQTDFTDSNNGLLLYDKGTKVYMQKKIIFTGDHVSNASPSFDLQNHPSVSIKLDIQGGRALHDASHNNIGKKIGIILIERNQPEVLTIATIQSELDENFQITGLESIQAANDLALLLRAGSLAAPMDIVEERTIGPSLGMKNINKGCNAVAYGFLAVSIFMIFYYMLFGVFSTLSLGLNLVLIVAVLSILRATITLPGIAAIAFTLGMAIDANVLINERIREELRRGSNPQKAISSGFSHAWITIFDSNATTLIAGFALLIFASGPVRGFAVVHCIGVITSLFSSIFFTRGLVNLWYGRKRKLRFLSIGQLTSHPLLKK